MKQLFMALSYTPSLSYKISVFVALAPAVYLGSLLQKFPVSLLINCPPRLYRSLFGIKSFLPLMSTCQNYLPPFVFMSLAYHMFHYLFAWTDTNWDLKNKNHYFQFTPRPQSTKNIHHWAQMGKAGVIKPFEHSPVTSSSSSSAPKARFDVSCVKCPVALYYGTQDTIIDGPKLYEACWEAGVELKAVEEVEGYEHMDCLWSQDARSRVWRRVLGVLESV
jgi:alpha-beta hydrolase superfamily lysophospholipase